MMTTSGSQCQSSLIIQEMMPYFIAENCGKIHAQSRPLNIVFI